MRPPRWWVLVRRGAHVTLREGSKSGAKCCGGGDFSAATPEEGSMYYGFQTQTAATEMTWPPRCDTPTGTFLGDFLVFLDPIFNGIFIPIVF